MVEEAIKSHLKPLAESPSPSRKPKPKAPAESSGQKPQPKALALSLSRKPQPKAQASALAQGIYVFLLVVWTPNGRV